MQRVRAPCTRATGISAKYDYTFATIASARRQWRLARRSTPRPACPAG